MRCPEVRWATRGHRLHSKCIDRGATNSAAMNRDDLVPGWIAQVGKIDFARSPFTPARRVLDALAAAGDAGVVESFDQLGAGAGEADGAAISVGRRLAIDRLGDAEHAGLRAIKDATLWVGLPRREADGAKHSVVECLRRGEIIGAEHYVCEHTLLSFCWTCPRLTVQAKSGTIPAQQRPLVASWTRRP